MIKRQYKRCLLSLGLIILFCFFQVNAQARDKGPESGHVETERVQDLQKQQELWNRAIAFLGDGNKKEAAPLFRLYYERYFDSKKAEEALWNAARLYKQLSLVGKIVNWDKVKDLYREFTVAFPDSEYLPLAYMEVGKAYMEMGYFREAVPYFGMIIRRFPEKDLVEEASILKGRALYRTGRVNEAVSIYKELGQTLDKNYERLANGYKYFREERYHDALGSFLKILKRDPSFYLKEADILRIMAECYLQTGQTEEGCRRLEHYLNLNSGSHRGDVLFRIGEIYLEEAREGLAARFYEKALAASDKGTRIYSFSRYRLSRLEKKKEKVGTGGDGGVSEEKFVKIREAVLEHGSTGEVIQGARLELIEYYWDSQEIDKVYDLGRIYLNYESEESDRIKVEHMICRILDNRFGELLTEEKYKDIYQIYKEAYPYIKRCQTPSVRIKVGTALERLSLYDKASVVYWRAMKLEMGPEEKRDLYISRAETYLAGKNYESADILLNHLRRVYKGKPVIGNIYFLSAKLRENQGKEKSALEFYERAVSESFCYKEKRAEFAERYLRLLKKQGELKKFSEELERFRKGKWLENERLQYWYVCLGDYYRKLDKPTKAGEAYRVALADSMPGDNKMIQKASLYYGDVQLALGNVEEAVDLHKKALSGPDQILTRIARQRLEEDEMTRSMSEVE